jgi:cell wall-associated NlpC family hydrolase
MPKIFDIPAIRSRRQVVSAVVVTMASFAVALPAHAQDGDSVAVAGGTVQQAGRAKPFAALSASAIGLRDSLVKMARAQVGRRYVLGGTSPDRGFDCSGLVKYVMSSLQVQLPRTAARQAKIGTSVGLDTAQLRPGDVLAFGRGRSASHVGIYVGNGRYIHASSVAGKVIESDINRPASPLIKRWRDTRRVVPSDSVAAIDDQ